MPTNEPEDKNNIGDKHFDDLVNRNQSSEGQEPSSDEAGEDSPGSTAEGSKSGGDLAKDETEGATPKASDAEAAEKASSSTGDGGGQGWYKPSKGKKNGKSRFSPQQKLIGGGFTGLLIGGLFALFSVLQGPLQVVHFAQLLQKFHITNNDDFTDGRAGRYLRHLFSGSAERGRLGGVKNLVADSVEARLRNNSGVKSIYSDPPARRLIGYEVIDDAKARDFIEQMDKEGVNTNGSPRGSATDSSGTRPTGRFIDIEVDSKGADIKNRRLVTRAAVSSTGHSKIVSRLSSRLLIQRGGIDFHPLKNKKREVGESLVKYYDDRKKERSERRKAGVQPPNKRTAGDSTDTDGDGKPDTSTDGLAGQSNDFINEAGGAKTPDARLKLGGKIAGGAAAIIGAMCVINDLGKGIDEYKYANIILVMMRMGMEIVATGSQVMSNVDMNVDELGSVVNDFYDEEKEESWAAAASIQYENGQELTGPDLPVGVKGSSASKKPALFEAVEKIPGINGVCGLEDVARGIPILGGALNLVDKIGEAGINAVLGLGGTSMEEIIESIIRVFAGEVVNTYAQGSELGNIASHGVRYAANDQIIALGGRKLADGEVDQLDTLAQVDRRELMASASFFERVLNINNVDSVAGTAMVNAPRTPGKAFAALMRAPMNLLSGFAKMGSSLVNAQNPAEKPKYDYGFPEFGFSLEEQNNPKFENPFENAEIVEPKLQALSDKYSDCFAMRIDPATGNLSTGPAKRYDEIEKKPECNDGSEDLLRFRFYLADLVTAHSLACYEGKTSSCDQIGNGQPQSAVTPSSTSSGSAVTGNVGESSDSVACAPGTNDIGVVQSKYTGPEKKSNPLMIRLCQIPEIPGAGRNTSDAVIIGGAVVNSRVSGAWQALGRAASQAGVPLRSDSSFRLNDSCGGSGDGSACATPGKSYHQLGVAIDFAMPKIKGTSTSSCSGRARIPSNAAWSWLYKNAESFGFKQYSFESWHWDPAQLPNRCGTAQ